MRESDDHEVLDYLTGKGNNRPKFEFNCASTNRLKKGTILADIRCEESDFSNRISQEMVNNGESDKFKVDQNSVLLRKVEFLEGNVNESKERIENMYKIYEGIQVDNYMMTSRMSELMIVLKENQDK